MAKNDCKNSKLHNTLLPKSILEFRKCIANLLKLRKKNMLSQNEDIHILTF